jgi:hypothetical protein
MDPRIQDAGFREDLTENQHDKNMRGYYDSPRSRKNESSKRVIANPLR